MAAPTLHQPTEIHPQGRIKDGDLWFKYGWNDNGTTRARDFYLRHQSGLLIVEFDENNGAGRRIASPAYLGNFPDLPFVQQSKELVATEAQLASKGINSNGPVNATASGKEIPFEITDATGKIAAKALPTDAGEEVKKATETVQTLANNLVGGGGTTSGGTASGSSGASSTRNILGWVLVVAGVALVVGGIVWAVKAMNKKKK